MNTKPTAPLKKDLIFLKLGGSLITDKKSPRTPRPKLLDRLAAEIQAGLVDNPGLQLLLGHGSGSFGHFSGKKYQTRDGVSTPEDWAGFAEVWQDASDLNSIVMESLRKAGLPAIAFPPSAGVLSRGRKISAWDLKPIQSALANGLLPVVYGDVVFDTNLGGTILSTEDLFVHLARMLHPQRILLAGQDPGVWQDFPSCTRLYEGITPADKKELAGTAGQSQATDVTGGMGDKVLQMLELISRFPDLDALIFSGNQAGKISEALRGGFPGTRLHS